MRTLNLGILAHVDAGKTTLTERLLFTAGAIDHVGSVDAGTTQTDSLELERERGITIRSAVASFQVGDLAVNLVDTPGHPDFIAEVERVLGVLDGAVLVVSAVEGVQPQTPLLFRALQRLRVPTLIFLNKIDRAGADPERSWAARRADCRRASCRWARRSRAGPPEAAIVAVRVRRCDAPNGADRGAGRARRGHPASLRRRRRQLTSGPAARALGVQTRRGHPPPGLRRVPPPTGIGIDALLAGIDELLAGDPGDPDADVSGRVFKIERSPGGERVAYVAPVRRHAAAAPARPRRWRGGRGQADLDPGLRARRGPAP